MFPNRRDLLKTGSLVALSGGLPGFLSRTAAQAPHAQQQGARDTILVVIQLTGGNDGLNTMIPFKDPEYAKLRPTLKQPENQIRKLNSDLGLHPAMTAFADLWQDSALCVVQGVGYPNPNQSHFRSMDIWQAASTERELTEGWVGKAMKAIPGAGSFHLAHPNEVAPLALNGAPVRVPSIRTLQDFQLQFEASTGADRRLQQNLLEAVAQRTQGPGLLDFVQRTAANTYATTRRLQEVSRTYEPKVPYPATSMGNHLKLAAQLIDAGLGARLFYVTLDGFDTHAGQAGQHAQLLGEVSNAIAAFFKDMSARGQRDRVLIMTFSEFGRRGGENGSQGTDHGSAAPMFLIGGKVKPGIVGAHPSLTNLDMGNLRHHTDFRQVYATVLDRWLGVASRPVLGTEFAEVDIFRRTGN